MSILINDMEMPETCDECNFHRYHSGGEYVCVATPMLYPFNLANSKGGRKTWCPLVEVPAAQSEQKKGEWLLGFNSQYLEKYYYCSNCGRRKYEEHKPLDNFCSNCGADMRGEKDE